MDSLGESTTGDIRNTMWVRNKSQNLMFSESWWLPSFFSKCYLPPPQKTEANLTIEEHIQTTGRMCDGFVWGQHDPSFDL